MAHYKPLDDAVTLWRKHNGITLDALASELGISPVTLSRKLRGDGELTLTEAVAIADKVGMSLDVATGRVR